MPNFTIEEIKIIKVDFSLKGDPGHPLEGSIENSDDDPLDAKFTCASRFDADTLKLSVILGVESEDPRIPFTFNVEICGNFLFESKPSDKTIEKVTNIHCPGIIFPYLREFVAELTRRGGYEPCVFQPMNFLAIYNQRKKEEAEARQKAKELEASE